MMNVRRRAWIAVITIMTLLVTGCSPPIPATEPQNPGTTMFGQFGANSISAVIDALASAQIEVLANDGKPIKAVQGVPSPVKVTEAQARNMTLEVTAGAGTRGAVLDDIVHGLPEGAPGPAEWMAAYAHRVDTAGARMSATLLGSQDLHDANAIVFPGLVQVLFVSDIATQLVPAFIVQNPGAATPGAAPAGVSQGQVESAAFLAVDSGPCETFGGIIRDVIFNVLNTLSQLRITAPTIDTGIPFLDSLVQGVVDLTVGALNFAIQVGVQLVVGAAKFALAPIMNAIALGAGVLAIVVTVLNAVKSWAVKVVPAQPQTSMGVEGQPPITDEVKAVVTVGGIKDWPNEIKACAALADVTLPSLLPGSAEVFWSPLRLVPGSINLAHVIHSDATLHDTPDGGEASLMLETGQEPKEVAENAAGDQSGIVRVDVRIRRKEIEDFRTSVVDVVTKLLAGPLTTGVKIIDDAVFGFIKMPINSVLEEIVQKGFDDTAMEFVTVVYHGPPEPKPVTSPSAATSWQGQWQSGKYEEAGTFTLSIVIADGELHGTIAIANSPCVSSGNIAGVADAGSVTFGSVEAGNKIQFEGRITADGKSMEGTYSDGDECGNDVGTWSAKQTR